MHITIAWWDRSDVKHQRAEDATRLCVSDSPGLLVANPISDHERNRDGWALVWETAADADVLLQELAMSTHGCAPSHCWAFDLTPSASQAADLPAQLMLLTS
ncbi:hypothetical protein ACFXKR_38065 [Streptomyces violascens]|uniref:hypothetical protein n=1 Tax=Streptomyces violascens TaxID=67381 RepID=UPI0036B99DDB